MSVLIIKRVETEEECKICDDFLVGLNRYETKFDNVLNNEFTYENVHKRSLGKDYKYIALANEENAVGYIFAYL